MAFRSTLQVVKHSPIRWELLAPLTYVSPDGHEITVPAGYVTDFASVPRLPLAYLLTGNTAHRASVVHDWLYETGATDRREADRIFRLAMRDSGVAGWRRALMWSAVRAAGWVPWRRHRRRNKEGF